jgi:EpsI family protein
MKKRLRGAALSRSGLGMLVLVILACLCLLWAQADRVGKPPTVGRVPLADDGWKGTDLPRLDQVVLQYLQPDSYIWREYRKGDEAVQLAVLYGRRKCTFHSPGFCLLSEGWNITHRSTVPVKIGGQQVIFNEMVLQRRGQKIVALYSFLHGRRSTPSWLVHQGRLLMARFSRRTEEGALVRIIVPVSSSEEGASKTGEEFLTTFFPHIATGEA